MRKHILAAALLSLTGLAHADEPPMGFYAGASLGNASLELEDSDSTADFEGDDTAFKLTVGYRFMKWLAVEGGYADYGEASDVVFGQRLRSDFSAFHASAVGMIPLGNFDLFGKAGFAAWEGELTNETLGLRFDEDNVDPLIGLGVQYRTGQFAIRAEIEGLLLGFDDDGDDEADGDDWIDFASVGVSWSF